MTGTITRYCVVIVEVVRIDAKSTRSEGLPERTTVSTAVTDDIRLDSKHSEIV